jgi:hypothetical protein
MRSFMALFAFEDPDPMLMPLAARRALDHGGLKLSLAGWQALPQPLRAGLIELGAAPYVEVDAVRALLRDVETTEQPVAGDPTSDAPPESLLELLRGIVLPAAVWRGLTPLARYALVKVAHSKRSQRLPEAAREILGNDLLEPPHVP